MTHSRDVRDDPAVFFCGTKQINVMRDSHTRERVYGHVMFPMMEAEDIHDELLGILNEIMEASLPPNVDRRRLEGLRERLARVQREMHERTQSNDTDEPDQ